ncbi:DUF6243 family protein [Streptomyces sp. NPDC048361]|uniref:DUF6243 family protein n=1 Tax=Streptomyces sp. NPDC048361 TaxID=3154720 RepID=UPI0034424CD4
MAKSRNNLLGVGGQRKKVSRNGDQGSVQEGAADRKAAVDKKEELLRRMRERANPATGPATDTATHTATEAGES